MIATTTVDQITPVVGTMFGEISIYLAFLCGIVLALYIIEGLISSMRNKESPKM